MRSIIGIIGVSYIALASQAITTSAAAQSEAQAAEAERPAGLEEIIVTAQRRAENLQRVPVSVTTLTADAISKSGVTSTDALLSVTPGLLMTRQAFGNQPYIRAVGSQSTVTGDESSVATYVDGVYYMSPNSTIFGFNNIERVEVLKGPQGTLFGRNATGGLVNVLTLKPQSEFMAKGTMSYANYGTYEGAFYATGGAENLATDIAIRAIRQDEGYGHNLISGEEVGKHNETSLRSKTRWTPTDEDSLTLALDWNINKNTIGLDRSIYPGSRAVGNVAFRGSPYDSQANFRGRSGPSHSGGVSLHYTHDFGGGTTLSSLTAYRDLKQGWQFDQDNTALRIADADLIERTATIQQELLLMSSAGRLDWTLGFFYFHADSKYDPLSIRSVTPILNQDTFSRQLTDSYAGFAQATYKITDTTRITGGYRYTIDERDLRGTITAAPGSSVPVGTVIATTAGQRADFPRPTWRIAIDQDVGANAIVYVSYNRGFKSGVFNISNFTQPPVSPEILDAYEAGLKSEWLDRMLRLNVAGFRYDYSNIQLSRVNAGQIFMYNAASATVNGFEAEATFAPPLQRAELQLRTGVSVLDGEYKSFPSGPTTTPAPAGGNVVTLTDLSGRKMVRAPDWTLNLGADLKVPTSSGEFGMTVNYYHSDGFFWEADNRIRQQPYDTLNAQVSYNFGSELQYGVRLFGRNLTDELYHVYMQESGLGDNAVPAAPLTYGIAVDFQF